MTAAHDRVSELFAQAIELDETGRGELIARVRADDAAIADELASLLDADARAKLATAGFAPLPLHGERAPRVPGYRVHGVLGEGGMGTVYTGEQIEPRRPVAIKVLHARSDAALLRFKAEAQIMARLDHPGIARVLEAGDADGRPFLVMELVEGATLDVFARDLPLERRLELVAELCDAVHHAHLHGVIHRDLKPSNVMVREGGRVVVLDFGVARLDDDESLRGATRDGELIGTPVYMSPEQALLRPDRVDARSDVYTLGVICYELVAGRLPYDVREMPLVAIASAIATDEPAPLGRYVPELRGDLEAIAAKALAKEPADRYQSAAALADDLRRYLAGEQVSARTPSAFEQLRRFVRRRPLTAAAIAGSVAAATAFAAIVTVLWLDARSSRRAADAARARAETAAQAAEASRAQLEVRTNELVLRQARSALARDPTEALAWLASATDRGVDLDAAAEIAREAIARGVAHDVVRGHDDEVHWVEPFRGGFVTGGYDGRALVWTGSPPRPRVAFAAKHGRVHAVRPSPDGSQLAIGGDDGALHVVGADGAVATLTGHAGDVQHLAWSADGAWLATGDDHGHVLLWPHGRAPAIALAAAPPSAIGDLAFAPDGRSVAAGDHAGDVWLWSLPGGAARTIRVGAGVTAIWTDGTRVQTVDDDGTVRAFRSDANALAVDSAVPTGLACKRAAFARSGAWVVLGGVGGSVTRVAGKAIEPLGHHAAQVRSLAISDDARWVASGGEDGSIEVRDVPRGHAIELHGQTGRIRHLAFAGDTLLSSDSDGIVRLWRLGAIGADALEEASPDAQPATVERLARSPDGSSLAAADSNGTVARWSLRDGARRELGRVPGRVVALAFAGDTVVTGTSEGAVTWWSEHAVQRTVHGRATAIAASADRVAVATSAGPIELFGADGTPAGELAGDPGGTEAIAFDASGTLLASGGQDRVVHVWRRGPTGFDELAPLPGPHGDTHYVAFSDDGAELVSAGNDGAVLAWTVPAAGRPFAAARVVAHHRGAVTALALHGHIFASAGRDAAVIRGSLDGGKPAKAALGAAAIALAFDGSGGVHAITHAGSAVRWPATGDAATSIDHGALAGVELADGRRWAVAFDDGALLIEDFDPPPLADLRARIAAATTYVLPH